MTERKAAELVTLRASEIGPCTVQSRARAEPRPPRRGEPPSRGWQEDEELRVSIETQGQLEPVIINTRRELVAGSRRVRAMRRIDPHYPVACIVNERGDTALGAAVLNLLENEQRQQLKPWECALAYQRIRDAAQCSQDELAAMLGRSKGTVSKLLTIADRAHATVFRSWSRYGEELSISYETFYAFVRDVPKADQPSQWKRIAAPRARGGGKKRRPGLRELRRLLAAGAPQHWSAERREGYRVALLVATGETAPHVGSANNKERNR